MSVILSPSLLSADMSDLQKELRLLEQAGITWLHLDVMDGHFVPNITFGASLISALRQKCGLFFDVHLMISEPGRYVPMFASAGADLLVAHLEAVSHPQRVLAQIRECGMKAGIALNPGTPIELCRWLLDDMDFLLLMSVNPGFSGQAFIPRSVEKVRAAREFLDVSGHQEIPIEVDGGVNRNNAALLARAGASVLVSGSAFFGASDYAQAHRDFLAAGAGGFQSSQATRRVAAWKRTPGNA